MIAYREHATELALMKGPDGDSDPRDVFVQLGSQPRGSNPEA